uniref:Cation transport regulator ChaB n=1 Tax=Acrobeloides nanus TaxID=290746 RepID=A0A914E1V7_9BILA
MTKTKSFVQHSNKSKDETDQDIHPKFHGDQDLPSNLAGLPSRAKEIYREAFNATQDRFSDLFLKHTDEPTGKVANRVALRAVKREFEQVGDDWYDRETGEGPAPEI